MEAPNNPGPSGVSAPLQGPPRQRSVGPYWSCEGFGHLAANCPKKTNQYPFTCSSVPFVCMPGVNHSTEGTEPKVGAKPRDVIPCEGDVSTEDSASTTDASCNKGVNGPDLSHSSEQTKPKDSVNVAYGFDSQIGVNVTDKLDIVQVLEQQGVDAADYIDQEHSVVGEVPPLIDWNNLVNRDTSGNEVMDFIDSASRLWEVEQQEGYQITQVKGRLKENFFWWYTLKAPTPVLDWINKGYVCVTIEYRAPSPHTG